MRKPSLTERELMAIESLGHVAAGLLEGSKDFTGHRCELTGFMFGLLSNKTLKKEEWLRVYRGKVIAEIEGAKFSITVTKAKRWLAWTLREDLKATRKKGGSMKGGR